MKRALRAMLDYWPFLAMLVPTLLLVTAAAVSLAGSERLAKPAAMLSIQPACDRVLGS